MFKIPTYDDLEKKEKDQNEKSKEYRLNLFEKRKHISLDETTTESTTSSSSSSLSSKTRLNEAPPSTSSSKASSQQPKIFNFLSPEKKARTEAQLPPVSSSNDDDDSLLMAFIDEKKDLIDQPRTQPSTTSDVVFKVPDLPPAPPQPQQMTTKILAPNVNTNTNANLGGGGALIVNSKQKGNPILKHIRNVQWKYSDTLVPDYCMSRNSCALFLSMKYHLLNPTYIHQRVKELGKAYDLRVLLAHVDVKEPRHCIKELEKICLYSNLTMILCWTPEEVGRYLETYKAYEFKSADLIMEKSSAAAESTTTAATGTHNQQSKQAAAAANADAAFISNFTDFLSQIKSINKTDSSTLRRTFGSIKEISKASKEELTLCPGLGPLKVNRLYNVFRTPFLLPKKPNI